MAHHGAVYHPPNVFYTQQMQYYRDHTADNQLNPSVPRFQPNGTELQRYQEDMQATALMTPDMALHRFGGNMYSFELSQVGRQAQQNAAEIVEMKEAFTRDFRELQRQMRLIRPSESEQIATLSRGPNVLEVQVAAPEAMLERFDESVTAELYLEQAQVFEDQAAQMKKTALELCPEFASIGRHQMKLIEAAKSDGGGTATPTHAPTRRSQHKSSSRSAQEKVSSKSAHAATQTSPELKIVQLKKTEEASTPSVEWKPLAVRNLKPLPMPTVNDSPSFTWEFLKLTLKGDQWSPGFYFIPPKHKAIPPSRSYWVLELDNDPFLPSSPGQHGAKLTAFFNSTLSNANDAPTVDTYMNVPLFICRDTSKNEYVYYGHYSQSRFSDRLDHDTLMDIVPENVRSYWADQLASKERPGWVTQELMAHFWPKPVYDGPMPLDSAVQSSTTAKEDEHRRSEKRVQKALEAYAKELMDWEKDARMRAGLLTKEALLDAFEHADSDEEPGLRLWWEYLECVAYDEKFVNGLEKLKKNGDSKILNGQDAAATPASNEKRTKQVNNTVQGKQNKARSDPVTAAPAINASALTTKPITKQNDSNAPPAPAVSKAMTGDLAVAKQLSAEFKGSSSNGKLPQKRGGKNRSSAATYAPPHKRG